MSESPFETCPVHGQKPKGTACPGYGTTLLRDVPVWQPTKMPVASFEETKQLLEALPDKKESEN